MLFTRVLTYKIVIFFKTSEITDIIPSHRHFIMSVQVKIQFMNSEKTCVLITYFPILLMYYRYNIVYSYLSDLVAAPFHVTCVG